MQGPGLPAILWIDDQLDPHDDIVRLLVLDGFLIECAASGMAGLQLALRGGYAGVLLDLHLPDMTGIAVLERLVQAGARTPVAIITGYADVGAALRAGQLGVTDFREKPVDADALGALLTVLVARGRAATAPALPELFASGGPPSDLAREIARRLADLAASARRAHGAAVLPDVLLCRMLAIRLAAVDETFLEFVAHARALCALRDVLTSRPQRAAAIRRGPGHARPQDWSGMDPRVHDLFGWFEQSVTASIRLSEPRAARAMGLHPTSLWRLLQDDLGVTFVECRRAIVMRLALCELAHTREHVSQIAYRFGYEHASSFNRDFRLFLRMSPKEYRELVTQETVKDQVKSQSL